MKVLILSSYAYSLINFRGELLRAMVEAGHDVVACGPDEDAEVETRLAEMGVRYVRTPMARTSSNPFSDLATLWCYIRLILKERPGLVLSYTQKPIIYGGIATRLVGNARFYALMTGLGYVFSPDAEARPILRGIVSLLYRAAVRHVKTVFVFNGDDRADMIAHSILDPRQRVVQVPGSGVDVEYFAKAPLPEGPPVFLMVARLMRDKGLLEYVEAARALKAKWPDAKFQLLGRMDTEHPTGVKRDEIEGWAREGIVDYLGETRDVRPFIAASTVFVLPSYYREGLPRTILEAMAMGRPIVTTDMPGCREPVTEGVNGFLVPARDSVALAQALEAFLANDQLAAIMGTAARDIAEQIFDVHKVNAKLMREMRLSKIFTPYRKTHDVKPSLSQLGTKGI